MVAKARPTVAKDAFSLLLNVVAHPENRIRLIKLSVLNTIFLFMSHVKGFHLENIKL